MSVSRTVFALSAFVVVVLIPSTESAYGQCVATENEQVMASDWVKYMKLGKSVSISGDTAVAGAHAEGTVIPAPGWAYVYDRNEGGPGNWGEVAILAASDGQADDRFGWASAISGDTIVVGAYQADPYGGNSAGAAYVFQRDHGGAGNWGEVVKLIPYDGEPNDNFGYAVAISGDTIVIGARSEGTSSPNLRAGAAYVFERDSGGADNWGQSAKFKAATPIHNEKFGAAVAISGDTIAVGDYNTPGYDGFGAAYVFVKPTGGWVTATETAKLTASDGAGNDYFGISVAIDGDVVVAGAYQDDDACLPLDPNCNSGSAYVFDMPGGGWVSTNQEDHKLTASDGVTLEEFGASLSKSGDVLLVASPQRWSSPPGHGAGYVYFYNGVNWVEKGKLIPSDGETYDSYAASVSLDGDQAVIGAFEWDYDDGGVPGRVVGAMYIFDYLSDCDDSGVLDICDIASGSLNDADDNGMPDECEVPTCELMGDVNDDDVLNALDVAGFVRVKLDVPEPGDNPACADYGTGSLAGDVQAFIDDLLD